MRKAPEISREGDTQSRCIEVAHDLIDARIFVAIVVMALVTSLMAGPMMSRLLWRHQAASARSTTPAMQRG